jgi:Putative transposase/Transposase zinc-binding domain
VVVAHPGGQATAPAKPRVIDAVRLFAPPVLRRRVRKSTRSTLGTLLACRTPALRGHRYKCEDCDYVGVLYNSCGNRNCPQCQGPRRHRWLEHQQQLLLPTAHFQVVFTLPAELREIAWQYQREVYDALLRAASDTVVALAKTRWGAMPAILSVLHTWSRDLSFHPHVHCVVSGGGLTDDDQWVAAPDYLFAVQVLGRLFRGKFLAELARLRLPLGCDERIALSNARSKAARKSWVAHVEAPQGRDPEQMLKYLSRYVYQTAISDHRMVAVTDETVTFRTRRDQTRTLRGEAFVRMLAQHFLPKGFRRVRHSGLLAPGRRPRLAIARARLDPMPPPPPPEPSGDDDTAAVDPIEPVVRRCPVCGGLLRLELFEPPRQLDLPLPRGPP